ncbi:PREDICTED: uncharacterized protein LOC108375577 [Rhagoletis zephyria]|uniref:uncharacterized protein LOC108375577 n=1 Tax=Rhagoletis zephyria TaxID=28612 RepID=UPI00081128AF|nr:PREDICTED: uncharacterized protein LOC108375577 [Rhagoletis zephyria]
MQPWQRSDVFTNCVNNCCYRICLLEIREILISCFLKEQIMDCAPLNLAHFHERRANRFLQRHRYDDAYKAVETSLIYLQDAFKAALMPKSVELLNTQKWEYQRKLCQIQMHKQQHERLKHKEIVPLSATNTPVVLLRADSNLNAQSVAKSIDKTVREFDVKLNLSPIKRTNSRESKEFRQNSNTSLEGATAARDIAAPIEQPQKERAKSAGDKPAFYLNENDEIPSLTPLELPSFEYHSFTASTPALTELTANFRKE